MGLAFLLIAAASAPVDVAKFERPRVLAAAARYLDEEPRTVTAAHLPSQRGRSARLLLRRRLLVAGSQEPGGPYVQRDGMTNPDNFVEHRRALMRLSVQVPTLAAAWRLTGERATPLTPAVICVRGSWIRHADGAAPQIRPGHPAASPPAARRASSTRFTSSRSRARSRSSTFPRPLPGRARRRTRMVPTNTCAG